MIEEVCGWESDYDGVEEAGVWCNGSSRQPLLF